MIFHIAVMSAVGGLKVGVDAVEQGSGRTSKLSMLLFCFRSFYLLIFFTFLLFFFFADQVVMISVAFLVILFSLQKYGTSKMGLVVGPALLIWFCCLAGIGIHNMLKYDRSVYRAFNPIHIYYFFKRNSVNAWYALGGCILCATGKSISSIVLTEPSQPFYAQCSA